MQNVEILWPKIEKVFSYVRINHQKLNALANDWGNYSFPTPSVNHLLAPQNGFDFIQFLGINSALNFGFINPVTEKRFSVYWQGQDWYGSEALSACLMRAINEGVKLLDANLLQNLEFPNMEIIFRGKSKKGGELPLLLRERWQILKEIGRVLNTYFDGHFRNVLTMSLYNCPRIISLLATCFPFSFGKDEFVFKPTNIRFGFYKKARLFASWYHKNRMAHPKNRIPILNNFHCLGTIVDYRLPQILRVKGVLVYMPELEDKIIGKIELRENDIEEQEIRLATAYAVLKLLRLINQSRSADMPAVEMNQLDYFLWKLGRMCEYPRHLTLTTNY